MRPRLAYRTRSRWTGGACCSGCCWGTADETISRCAADRRAGGRRRVPSPPSGLARDEAELVVGEDASGDPREREAVVLLHLEADAPGQVRHLRAIGEVHVRAVRGVALLLRADHHHPPTGLEVG